MTIGTAESPAAGELVWTGRPLRIALWLIGVVATLVWICLTTLVVANTGIAGPLTAYALIGLANIWIGLVAWARRPHNLTGLWLCVTGFLIFLAVAGNLPEPLLNRLGSAVSQAPIAAFLHVLLAFPSGRLRGRPARILTVTGYVVTIGIDSARLVVFPGPGIPGWFPDAALEAAFQDVQRSFGVLILGAASVLLLNRVRVATARGRDRGERRALIAVYAWGIGMLWFIPLSSNVVAPLLHWSPVTLFVAQVAPFAMMPFVFATGILRGGFARSGQIEELGAWLGANTAGRPPLRSALATTLGDPTLRILFAVPTGWLDSDGNPAQSPTDPGPARGVHLVSGPQGQVAAIDYDAGLIASPRLVEAAANVVALALDRDRLTADLISSRELIRASRARLVEVGDLERRRIAADLHDLLQARLVLAAMHAGALLHAVPAPAVAGSSDNVAKVAATIRNELDDAIVELRGLLHGLMPALLLERGVFEAVADLVDRVPIPAAVTLDDGGRDDIAPALASSCYLIVSEAVTNAVKHSGATLLIVELARTGAQLRLRVADNGRGGAAWPLAGGSVTAGEAAGGAGLTGLADRVDALGGTMTFHSPPGGGTSIVAELPCES